MNVANFSCGKSVLCDAQERSQSGSSQSATPLEPGVYAISPSSHHIHTNQQTRISYGLQRLPQKDLEKSNISKPNQNIRVKVNHLGFCLLSVACWILPFHAPASASYRNDYETCAGELLDVNIAPQVAADVCAEAWYPEELSSCVVDIDRQTDIIAQDALNTCQKVRRPLELATCVVDISAISSEGDALNILDHCRRSLLPARFSQCVVGLKNQIDLVTSEALFFCIDTRNRNDIFDPTFIPRNKMPSDPNSPPEETFPST